MIYVVQQRYFNDGKIEAHIIEMLDDTELPSEGCYGEYDEYFDMFPTMKEAYKFLANSNEKYILI